MNKQAPLLLLSFLVLLSITAPTSGAAPKRTDTPSQQTGTQHDLTVFFSNDVRGKQSPAAEKATSWAVCPRSATQPEEGTLLRIQAKQPGLTMWLSPVDMHFTYQEAFQTSSPDAYETLLLDVMIGDATLFMRADQVEAAWSVVTPILEGWKAVKSSDFPNYSSGTWGPEAAEALISRDGRKWLLSTSLEKHKEEET